MKKFKDVELSNKELSNDELVSLKGGGECYCWSADYEQFWIYPGPISNDAMCDHFCFHSGWPNHRFYA